MMPELSLFQFVTALMRDLRMIPSDGYPTPIQCQILEAMEGPEKRKVISAFRGCGKSTLAAMRGLHLLYRNPDEKLLILSASERRAVNMTAWMLKTITTVPWLQHMRPSSFDGRYSKLSFDVGTCQFIEQSPSVRGCGIEGQVTGDRATYILPDDIETPYTAMTQVQRRKLRTIIDEFESIIKPADECPQAEICFLGTPHSADDSTYYYLHRQLGYSMTCWPARVPQEAKQYRGTLAPRIEARMKRGEAGAPTDTRFSDAELKKKQLKMSPAKWKLQFMLDPTLTDQERYPLRCGDLMVMADLDTSLPEVVTYEKAKYLQIRDIPCPGMAHDPTYYRPQTVEGSYPAAEASTVMVLDPSGGGADEFAWAVLKAYAGNYFLMDVGGKRGGVDDAFWKSLAMKAQEFHCHKILVETNFGGLEIYQQVLKGYLTGVGHPCHVEGINSTGQRKEIRIIDTLAPILQTHRMVVSRRVVEEDADYIRSIVEEDDAEYSVMYQLSRISYDKNSLVHDDRLDAWAMGVQWFQKQAVLNQYEEKVNRSEAMLRAEIEDENGWALMSVQRMAFGHTMEMARKAETMGNISGNLLKPRGRHVGQFAKGKSRGIR